MTEFLAFALIGLGPGAIYALAALGVVQIFRGSDTLNFAHGGMALVGATVMFQFWHKEELPLPLVLVLVLLTGVLLGVLSSLTLWPLRASSATVRIIATTGILAILVQGLLLIFGDALGAQSVGLMPTYYPNGGWEITAGITIGYDRLILLAIAVALTVAVRTFMMRTRFGMATVGASESPVAARALGFSPLLLSLGNWGLGGALATLTGALLVPLSGLTSGPIVLMLVPAFAAALIGNFRSYYVTLAGALGLGMAQALTTRYVGDVVPPEYATGWADAIPLIVIAVILTVRGTALTARGEHSVRMPRVGRVRPNPLVYVVLTLAGVVVALLASNELAPSITSGVLFAFIVLSLVVVVGLSGQLSFAQMALGGLGALISARLALEFDFGFVLALVIGTVAAGAVGAVFSIPVLRTRGPSLAIVTLGLALAVEHVVFANVNITGGFNGTPTKAPKLAGQSIWEVEHPQRYAVVVIVLFAATSWCIACLASGKVGRRLSAVRSNERAATALGISVRGAKMYAFVVGAMIAGLGGVLIGYRSDSVNYTNFLYAQNLSALSAAVIGGIGFVLSAFFGIFQLPTGPFPGYVLSDYTWYTRGFVIASGLILITTLIQFPDGMSAPISDFLRKLNRRRRKSGGVRADAVGVVAAQVATAASAGARAHIGGTLEVRNLSVVFGSVKAVANVSLTVAPGKVLGVIGANGAGKSTLIDAVTGFVRPSAGQVFLDGTDITAWNVRRRARAGLQRCFQQVELFEDLTVGENLSVALEEIRPLGWIGALGYSRRPQLSAEALEVAEQLGIASVVDEMPMDISFGQRRLIGVARALAARPKVLLLDEPAAGLDAQETEELGQLIRTVAHDWGIAVLLVEHDVPMVTTFSDSVIAIDFGREIATGRPHEVLAHPDVRRAYLGEEPDDEPEHAEIKTGVLT